MRNSRKVVCWLTSILVLGATASIAGPISTDTGQLTEKQLRDNYSVRNINDNANAPVYGSATHGSSEWNHLGEIGKSIDGLNNDGVTWSTDGIHWANDAVNVGDFITFQISLWSSSYGRHDYDQVKAWVDWGNDGWDNDTTVDTHDSVFDANKLPGGSSYFANDVVIADYYEKPDGLVIPDGSVVNPENSNDIGSDEAKILSNLEDSVLSIFQTGSFEITSNMADSSLWLRARAQCNHTPYNTMTAYNYLSQGEVEDWEITVTSVPEPSLTLLLGTGIIGLVGSRIRRKKK